MIACVGIGPGNEMLRTPAAQQALAEADVLVGYRTYIDLIEKSFPGKVVYANGMTGEVQRCQEALRLSREGKYVAVVCSGDAGVYGMASLLLELADARDEIEIVPGVTAALAASALLGAPISGDFAVVSLSDRLTPWEKIAKRLRAAAEGDWVLALYNPGSHGRPYVLREACDVLLCAGLSPDTPCGFARNVGRPGQIFGTLLLSEMAMFKADMFTTIIIGNSETKLQNGRMITPRGYST